MSNLNIAGSNKSKFVGFAGRRLGALNFPFGSSVTVEWDVEIADTDNIHSNGIFIIPEKYPYFKVDCLLSIKDGVQFSMASFTLANSTSSTNRLIMFRDGVSCSWGGTYYSHVRIGGLFLRTEQPSFRLNVSANPNDLDLFADGSTTEYASNITVQLYETL